jgi:small-conductance mechanosensitive channel
MDDVFSAERFAALYAAVREWFLANVLVTDNALQLLIILTTLGLGAVFARRLVPRLRPLEAKLPVRWLTQALIELLLPLTWLVLLWLAVSAAALLDRPDRLMRIVATLIVAWIVIHLAARTVTNPLLAKLVSWTAWSIAALSILGLLEPTIAVLDAAAIEIGALRISLYTVLRATISLAVLLSVAVYLTRVIETRMRTSQALSPSVQVLFAKSLKIALVSLAVLIALRGIGIDLTGLAVLGGAFGLGAGFGLQKIVSNLISGVILLVDKSIKPGDVIAVSGTYGWVTALGGRYVSVVTRDGVEHLIPNETLISERVENWTHTNSRTRLRVDVGVHYKSDIKKVLAICEEAATEIDRVLKEPKPVCLFIEFGDSALKVQLRFWISDAQNGVQNVKSAVLLRIWEKFREHEIEVPYPQRDLHIRSSALDTLSAAPARP